MKPFLSLCFVEVIYGQNYKDTKTFKSIMALISTFSNHDFHILLYDNSPQAQEIEEELGIILTYHHDSRNLGVMTAYQYAFEYCESRGIDWMLRLDQDSSFDALLLEHFMGAQSIHQNCSVFIPRIYDGNRLISPTYVNKGGLYSKIKENEHGLMCKPITYINSMSFIRVNSDTVKQAIYSAKFLLDLSDHEFAFKIPLEQVYVMNTKVKHELSVLDIQSINAKRYEIMIANEMSFMKATQDAIGLLIYYVRLLVRSVKLFLKRRNDLLSIVLQKIMKTNDL